MCLFFPCVRKAKPEDWLKNKRALKEITLHLWLESEKAGHDIGFKNAADDWIKNRSAQWVKDQFIELQNIGLLILRIGIGIMLIFHGWPKITAGPDMWEKLGMATGSVGIHFAPTFFGLMAALAEYGGGICLALGLATRTACVFLFIEMAVAAAMHLTHGDGLAIASHAIESGILFLSLVLIGPGKYSFDEKFSSCRR